MRRALDGAIKVELFGRASAREFSQTTKCKFDIARAEFNLIIEILELPFVPNLDGAKIPVGILADANAFRIVSIRAVRRGPGRADPF